MHPCHLTDLTHMSDYQIHIVSDNTVHFSALALFSDISKSTLNVSNVSLQVVSVFSLVNIEEFPSSCKFLLV